MNTLNTLSFDSVEVYGCVKARMDELEHSEAIRGKENAALAKKKPSKRTVETHKRLADLEDSLFLNSLIGESWDE